MAAIGEENSEWVKAVAGKKQEAPERGFSLLAMLHCEQLGWLSRWRVDRAPERVDAGLLFDLVEPLDLVLGTGALRQFGTQRLQESFNLLVQHPGRADDQHA